MKIFYIGLENQLVIIQEQENDYTISSHLEKTKVNHIAFHPENNAIMYVATDHGFWISKDSGESYKQLNNGLTSTNVTALTVSPHKLTNGQYEIFIGTEPSRIFSTIDEGESWNELTGLQDLPSKSKWSFPPRPESHYVRWLTTSHTDANYLAASIEAGAVIYTTDHGKTWNDRAEMGPIDVHTLLMHPDAPARLYAANGGLVTGRESASYAESEDGGHSWAFMSEGLGEHTYLYNMILHPTDPDTRLVSASASARTAHRQSGYATVYLKSGDEDWEELAEGLPTEGVYSHQLANDPNDVGGFYAQNNKGIYHLKSDSNMWKWLDIPWLKDLFEMRPYFFTVIDR